MKKILLMTAALVAAVVSCQKEFVAPGPVDEKGLEARDCFIASLDQSTKTTIDGNRQVRWAEDDSIAVNGVIYKVESILDSTARTAEFKKCDTKATPKAPFTAVFPVKWYNADADSINVPQTIVRESDGDFSMPLKAYTTNRTMVFENTYGVIAVKVDTTVAVSNVKYITLKQNDTDTLRVLECESVQNISAEGNIFYIPLAPGVYDSLKVFVKDADSNESEMFSRLGSAIKIEAGTLYAFNYKISLKSINIIDNEDFMIAPDRDTVLAVEYKPADATNKDLLWTSSDSLVATVTGKDINTATLHTLNPGTVQIVVKSVEGGYTDTCEVLVKVPVTAVSIVDADSAAVVIDTIFRNETLTLHEMVEPFDATCKDVTWTSTDTAVLKVSGGIVTPVKEGTADVIVEAEDGFRDTCTIRIFEPGLLKVTENGEITDYINIDEFRDSVNSGVNYSGCTLSMLGDVDLTDGEWEPIGSDMNSFGGVFDGNGKTISLSNSEIEDSFGLFGYIAGSQGNHAGVKNLNLKVNLRVKAGKASNISALSVNAQYCDFSAITVEGSIASGEQAAAMVLRTADTVNFKNCTNKASLSVILPSGYFYSKVGGMVSDASGCVSFTSCRNEGKLSADNSNAVTAKSYIGHIAAFGGNMAITSCSYADTAEIKGWSVLDDIVLENTYPFEGVIEGRSHKTYFETLNPGKIMVGGNFTKCTLDGVPATGFYPNGVAHIQMTTEKYLSEVNAEAVGNEIAARGFVYKGTGISGDEFYKSKYDSLQFASKAAYSEQYVKDEYTCYVPLDTLGKVIAAFGDAIGSSGWNTGGNTPAVSTSWSQYKTALEVYDFSSPSVTNWNTGNAKVVYIYGEKVSDTIGKIIIKTKPFGSSLTPTTNHNLEW